MTVAVVPEPDTVALTKLSVVTGLTVTDSPSVTVNAPAVLGANVVIQPPSTALNWYNVPGIVNIVVAASSITCEPEGTNVTDLLPLNELDNWNWYSTPSKSAVSGKSTNAVPEPLALSHV